MTASAEWLVESLRFTGFLAEPLEDPASINWWSDVVGEQAADLSFRPREGRFQWTGNLPSRLISSATLSLQVEPLRADWNLAAAPRPEDPVAFATIGPLLETSNAFLESLEPWASNIPPCPRLALGGAILLLADNVEAAYERLSEFLPSLDIDPAKSRDLLYRINRPRHSRSLPEGHPGINRISTWSVVTIRSILFAIPGPVVDEQQGPSALRLEFDINTIPNQTSLIPSDVLPTLSAEFQELAVEIAERGDTP